MTTALLSPPVATGTAVADLILVRMAVPSKMPPAPSAVRTDVGKLLGRDLSAAEFDDLRNELAAAGELAKGKRSTFTLTAAGRERALRFLGITEFPPRTNWGTVVAKFLFPKAAGLTPGAAAKLDNGGKLAAHLLRTKYGVPATDAGTLRRLMIRDGLAGLTPEPVHQPEPVTPEPFDLPAFAGTVLALARTSPPADRFHDNKVFIAPLWRASQTEPNFPRLTLAEFKQRLIEANARHLLHLSRADFVQAMDPQLVAESETEYLNATFHFVRLEGDRP